MYVSHVAVSGYGTLTQSETQTARPGFELGSPFSLPMTITVTLKPPRQISLR